MHFKESSRTVNQIIEDVDRSIWQQIALKAVSNMPKYKLSKETYKIIDDFSKINQKISNYSGKIVQEIDPNNPITQNYILGTMKIVPKINQLVHQPLDREIKRQPSHKFKNRAKSGTVSTMAKTHNKINKISDNTFKTPQTLFKLTLASQQDLNNQNQHANEHLRALKEQDYVYNKQLEQKYRQLRARSMEFSKSEKQKYKDVKKFTYDYEGKLVSLKDKNHQKTRIISIQGQLFEQAISIPKKKKILNIDNKNQKTQEILNKKIIKDDKQSNSAFQVRKRLLKQKQQKLQEQKNQKMSKFLNNMDKTYNNFGNVFKERSQISQGVCIIDAYNNNKIEGTARDKDIRQYNLEQFKSQSKGIQSYKQKLLLKKPKTAPYINYKTQYTNIDQQNINKAKTLRSEISNLTSLGRYIKNNGKITIKDEHLYSQHFSESFK